MSNDTRSSSPNQATSPKKLIDRKSSVKDLPMTAVHGKFQELQKGDLVNLLCILEAEVQARDLIISAIMKGDIGNAMPLSHLLGDGQVLKAVRSSDLQNEDDDVWLGEPTAHLNHVVAYHQLVREQMQAMLQDQHKTILRQLEEERQIHAIDTAQGDQVTYMLEKDRERLTNEIEFQQVKLSKAEKERDKLMLTLEKVREDQQNEFSLLVNDCKMFAKQIVEQAQKEEQLQKDIEQEKRKNRVLSELMVEEQKKFKEWLRKMDDERAGQISLEKDRVDLEQKLIDSEKRAKESHQKYLQESQRAKQLEIELKQLRLRLSSEDSFESGENSDELVEGSKPSLPQVANAKIKQMNTISTKTASHISLETLSSTLKAKQGAAQEAVKEPYVESPSSSPKIVRPAGAAVAQPSYEHSPELKNKKIPPPTPPRISSITAKSVPVLSSDSDSSTDSSSGNFIRSYSAGASSEVSVGTIERRQPVVGSPDSCTVLVAVAAGYGWGFSDEEGLEMSDSILDFIGELRLKSEADWGSVTEAVKKIFLDKVPWKASRGGSAGNSSIFQSSVSRFELGSVAWAPTGYPVGMSPWTAAWQDRTKPHLIIRLKDETTLTFDSVAYSTSVINTSLQEYCRLIKRYRNVLFMTEDTIEAKHFISCFSHWLKTVDEIRGKVSVIASVEENEICTAQELIRLLREYGALVEVNREKPQCSTIILIDVDFIISRKLSSDVFVWLGKRGTEEPFYLGNGLGVNSQLYYLQDDVIVLAYATKKSMDRFGQAMHRFFKLIDLPPTMPVLLQRWLRQKATRNRNTQLSFKEIDNWSSWISDVYRRSRIDLEKLDIKLDMPDLGLFLSAPFNDSAGLKSWAEDLWLHHFLPQVESSVEEQVAEATNTQQDLLIQVALNAFLEGAFLPGCPCRLDIG